MRRGAGEHSFPSLGFFVTRTRTNIASYIKFILTRFRLIFCKSVPGFANGLRGAELVH